MLNEEENDDTTVTVNSTTNLTALVDDKAWAQLMGFVTNVGSNEASGYFLYTLIDNEVHIHRAFLIKGTASPASTEMDQDAKAKFLYRMYRHGLLKPGTKWRLGWFHFHTTFQPFWSGTDRQQRDEFSANKDFFASLVMNNKGEYMLAIDMKHNGISVGIDTIPLQMIDTGKKIPNRNYKAECDRKIRGYVYPVSEYKWGSALEWVAIDRGEPFIPWWEQEAIDEAKNAKIQVVQSQGGLVAVLDDPSQGYCNIAGEIVHREKINEWY